MHRRPISDEENTRKKIVTFLRAQQKHERMTMMRHPKKNNDTKKATRKNHNTHFAKRTRREEEEEEETEEEETMVSPQSFDQQTLLVRVVESKLNDIETKVPLRALRLSGLRQFIVGSGAVGLAVGLVVGGCIKEVVDSFTVAFISPLIALVGRKREIEELYFEVSDARFQYGMFLGVMLETFFTLFFVYYAIVIPMNALTSFKYGPLVQCDECASWIKESAKKCPYCCSPRVDERREKESTTTTTTEMGGGGGSGGGTMVDDESNEESFHRTRTEKLNVPKTRRMHHSRSLSDEAMAMRC